MHGEAGCERRSPGPMHECTGGVECRDCGGGVSAFLDDDDCQVYESESLRAVMRNYRCFRGLYFEEISVEKIEASSLEVRGWPEARKVIPSGFDLAGIEWEPIIEDVDPMETTALNKRMSGSSMLGTAPSSDSRIFPVEEAKHTLSSPPTSTSGGCVSFLEPSSADDDGDDDDDSETYLAAMRRNTIAQLFCHLGPEHVAMLQAFGALEELVSLKMERMRCRIWSIGSTPRLS